MINQAHLEWTILDNLSDDWECPATICKEVADAVPEATRQTVLRTLLSLHEQGLVRLQNGNRPDPQALLSEREEDFDTPHWFALTPEGCTRWERDSMTFSGSPISWSEAWSGHVDFASCKGHVDGTNEAVCLSALPRLLHDDKWTIDMTSLAHSEIPGFRAKYYKYLTGGHRIDFRIRKK
jgi:hypothetical protein